MSTVTPGPDDLARPAEPEILAASPHASAEAAPADPTANDPKAEAAKSDDSPTPDTTADGTDRARADDKAKPEPVPPEPQMTGETRVDRISSMLLSAILGSTFAVGWVLLMLYTQRSYARPTPPRVEIIEVYGGEGGTPEGKAGDTENIEISGAELAEMASNNMEDASAFEEPKIEETSSAVIDALADVPPEELTEVDMADALPNAEMVATGKKSSKLGTGDPFGSGHGQGGGVPREQRWSLVFPPGQTVDEYARQLDFFGIVLAVPSGSSTMDFVQNFASPAPSRVTGPPDQTRMYLLWQGAGRKSTDIELMQRAGVTVGNQAIFQYLPPDLEDTLSQLEYNFKQRQPAQVRKTRFQVVSGGGRYEFRVQSQEPMYESAE